MNGLIDFEEALIKRVAMLKGQPRYFRSFKNKININDRS